MSTRGQQRAVRGGRVRRLSIALMALGGLMLFASAARGAGPEVVVLPDDRHRRRGHGEVPRRQHPARRGAERCRRRRQAEHPGRQHLRDAGDHRDDPRGRRPGDRLGRAGRRLRRQRRHVHHAVREHRPHGAGDDHRRRVAGQRRRRGHRRDRSARRSWRPSRTWPSRSPSGAAGPSTGRSRPSWMRRPTPRTRRSTSGAVDGIAGSIEEVIAFANGRTVEVRGVDRVLDLAGATVTEQTMNPLLSLIRLISDPNIAFLLFSLGSTGLLVELYSPNFVTGILGGLALILGLMGLGHAAAERRRPAADRLRARPVRAGADRDQPRPARRRGTRVPCAGRVRPVHRADRPVRAGRPRRAAR